MDLSNQKIEQNESGEITNTLSEILNSINLETNTKSNTKSNIVNYIEEDNKNQINNSNIITKTENQEQNISYQVKLLSNDIDRKIGNYLLNELEKKQLYIDELEEAIIELKSKIEAFNKLELLSKIKSNMETKLANVGTNLSQVIDQEHKPKVVQIKKFTQQTQQNHSKDNINEEQTQYLRTNSDLVFRSEPEMKVKSISKEEEEPRYNGIIMLDKPKNEPQIKIQLDYDTETFDNSSMMSDVIKQRRRRAGKLFSGNYFY